MDGCVPLEGVEGRESRVWTGTEDVFGISCAYLRDIGLSVKGLFGLVRRGGPCPWRLATGAALEVDFPEEEKGTREGWLTMEEQRAPFPMTAAKAAWGAPRVHGVMVSVCPHAAPAWATANATGACTEGLQTCLRVNRAPRCPLCISRAPLPGRRQ